MFDFGSDNKLGFSDPFSKMLESQMEEMKKHNEELEEKRKTMEARIEKVVKALDGLSYGDAEAVLDNTKSYLRINLIVKA